MRSSHSIGPVTGGVNQVNRFFFLFRGFLGTTVSDLRFISDVQSLSIYYLWDGSIKHTLKMS